MPENDSEWYRLVPPEAREVLDRKEVQRQSVLFEIIKSERDYVADLELVKEVRFHFVLPFLYPVSRAKYTSYALHVGTSLGRNVASCDNRTHIYT